MRRENSFLLVVCNDGGKLEAEPMQENITVHKDEVN